MNNRRGLLVAVDDGIKYGHHEGVDVLLVKSLLFQKGFKELTAFHELHHQTVMALVFKGSDQLDYIRMINLSQDGDLILHS